MTRGFGIFEMINGFLWPSRDTECKKVVFSETAKIDKALRHTNGRAVCVQAGGNCGVFPKYLSPLFGTVYTFEPHPDNFHCLASNVPEANVIKMQAALGERHGMIHMELTEREKTNYGAFYMRDGGDIPVLLVDDLHLDTCDLIILDIEGAEGEALRGAAHTIRRFHPTLLLEEKGLSVRYGKASVEEWCVQQGYTVVDRMLRDIILI